MLRILTFLLFAFCFNLQFSKATHLVAAQFEIDNIANDSAIIRLVLYRDCQGIQLTPSASINWSSTCGSGILNLPQISVDTINSIALGLTTCDTGSLPGYEKVVYEVPFAYPSGCGMIDLSYSSCCRNNAITNVVSPGAQNFYVSSSFDVNYTNQSPVYFIDPVFYAQWGQNFFGALGGVDLDGDSLDFSFLTPAVAAGQPIGLATGISTSQPFLTLGGAAVNLNSQFGILNTVFDTVFQVPIFDLKVDEYRNGQVIASHRRCIQFVTMPNTTNNTTPLIPQNNTVQYYTGGQANLVLSFEDPDSADVLNYLPQVSTLESLYPSASVSISRSNLNRLTMNISIPNASDGDFVIVLEENNLLRHHFTYRLEAAVVSAINTVNSSAVRVYPQPVEVQSIFELGASYEAVSLRLYNQLGQEVLKVEENNVESIQLDRGNLPTGIYFYELRVDGKVLDTNRLILK